jgi:hypothetical protein
MSANDSVLFDSFARYIEDYNNKWTTSDYQFNIRWTQGI